MSAILHPNQSAMAKELGIDAAELASPAQAIIAIETKLGKESTEVRTRWFVVSVLRHLRKAKWVGLDDCSVDENSQKSLAADCIAVQGFTASLRTVTKDHRSKFRIVGFASSKNIERCMLATGTKAYKIAVQVLHEAGLVEEKAGAASAQPKSKMKRPELKAVEKSVVGRRAKRRGYGDAEHTKAADSAETLSSKHQLSMSEAEFARLDAALSESDAEIVQQSWHEQPNEDRWSRILGILAGVGFFLFVALLFL